MYFSSLFSTAFLLRPFLSHLVAMDSLVVLLAEKLLALVDLQILRGTKMSLTQRLATPPASHTALTGLVLPFHLHHLAKLSTSFKASS
jgi:hypothetical protein